VSSISLSLADARRLAVQGALLAAPRPSSILDVVRHLGRLQMDPTSAVARSELLVLWSRLGAYDVGELERLLWEERKLFEYRAFIVPSDDFPLHRLAMRRYPRGDLARAQYVRGWMAANSALRRHILLSLRRRGPLRTRDFEDRAVENWRTGGWNEGKNVSRMLELLSAQGKIVVAGREGPQRLWDLAERRLPGDSQPLPKHEVARRLLDRQLRWCGFARPDQFGFAFDGRPPGRERALRDLIEEGRAVPITVEGLRGEWLAHADILGRPFRPRTTLLSPFDPLIAHRQFTEDVFGFRFRLEIYVPKSKREYGYFVLPILHGERLIGRIDPFFDRKTRVLRVNAVYAERDAPAGAGPAIARAIRGLADWLGADAVSFGRVPRPWKTALRAA
jgi:uncharacterized protein YcaQ